MAAETKRPSRSHMPVSLEAERRRVMITVHATEKDLQQFWEAWLRNARADLTDVWLDCVYLIYDKYGGKKPAKDPSEFESYLKGCENDPLFSHRPEFSHLEQVCRRSEAFEEFISRSRSRMESAVENHLAKYCLSFVAELDDFDVPSVMEYENNISKWREEIHNSFKVIDKTLSEMRKVGDNFTSYVQNYRKILSCMNRVCDAFVPMFEPIKDWVMADENYPRRIQDDINRLAKTRLELQQENRRYSRNAGSTKSKVCRRKYQTVQIQNHLEDLLEERRSYRKRELTLRQAFAKTETDLERKKRNLRDISEQYSSRRSTASHKTLELWSNMADQLQDAIIRLQKKLEVTKGQIGSLQTDRYLVQKKIHKVQGDLDDSMKRGQSVKDNMTSQEQGVRDTQEEIKNIAAKIEALKRIREIKLHSSTVKRIFLYGYSPGGKLDIEDPLEGAFRLAASEIGKEWSLLYQRLPFKPRRDIVSRTQDIENIDISSRRLDPDFATLCLKGLDKWRRLSDYVSVNALVGTLRRIKKNHVAEKIERSLLAET